VKGLLGKPVHPHRINNLGRWPIELPIPGRRDDRAGRQPYDIFIAMSQFFTDRVERSGDL
jgi:hypothetical protein